jgi:hypothetical protein
MSNDEVKKQAEQAARVKQNIVAVNNLNIPQQSQSHVLPVANTPSIGEQARRNEAATENREREKSAYTVEKTYGYVVSRPRQLTPEERNYINASSLVPSNPGRKYEMVKFYANGTPTDAIPSIGIFPEGSFEEQLVLSSLPEALHDTTDGGSLSAGQIICIEYREPNHGFPVVSESTPIVGGVTAEDRQQLKEVSASGDRSAVRKTLKDNFYTNPEKGILRQDIFVGRKRELATVDKLVFHETGLWSADLTLETLINKGAGVHYLLKRDGMLSTVAAWDQALGHASNWNVNQTSLGVEVDNVVNPVKYKFVKKPESEYSPDYQHFIADGIPWKADRKGNRGYVFPSRNMFESAWSLCRMVTTAPSLNIPMKFIGLDKNHGMGDNNLFILTGAPPSSEYKEGGREKRGDGGPRIVRGKNGHHGPGIYAHSYIHHGDGAILSLYCYLRSVGYPPEQAYFSVIHLNTVNQSGPGLYETPNLIKKSNGHWYADLNKIPTEVTAAKDEALARQQKDAKFRTDLGYEFNEGTTSASSTGTLEDY